MIIKNGLIYLPGEEELKKIDIKIDNEKFSKLSQNLKGEDVFDASGLIVLPGGIDPHVHFDDPGYTEREDFFHGSMAAAAGGITTVIDMPNTNPALTTRELLEEKKKMLTIIIKKSS